jgi:cellulose synthase/poly-beta-1,6-N-acetylglucosamine synthase-like glycosyltransferase
MHEPMLINERPAAQPTYVRGLSVGGALAVALPRVSVIVTAYNYARYIGECLASIRAQTYTNFECVVVDDRSADGTR